MTAMFVLFLIINSDGASGMVAFNSQSQCEAAGRSIEQELRRTYGPANRIRWFCAAVPGSNER